MGWSCPVAGSHWWSRRPRVEHLGESLHEAAAPPSGTCVLRRSKPAATGASGLTGASNGTRTLEANGAFRQLAGQGLRRTRPRGDRADIVTLRSSIRPAEWQGLRARCRIDLIG